MKSLTIAFLFAFCAMVARADNAPSYTPDEKAFLPLMG
jgi:hypothetical protein